MSRTRAAALTATGLLLGGVLLWHMLPWLLWNLRFEAQLEAEGGADRMRTETWEALSGPPADWVELVSGDLSLHAPLARESLPACGRCATQCRLPLANRGTLGIFDERSRESYGEALDRYAPDARDVSLLRSVASNWRTIDALTDRVRNASEPPQTFRFESPQSRGVVTAFRVDGVSRYVIYAYSRGGEAARLIGVAGLERPVFERLLASLRIEPDHADRGSVCTPDR